MKIDSNNPRLTAYALGELNDADRAEVEAFLKDNEPARREVETIRRAAAVLTEKLEAEECPHLAPEQLAEIKIRVAPVTTFSWWRFLGWGSAVAGATVMLWMLFMPALSSTREKARRVQTLRPVPRAQPTSFASLGTINTSGGAIQSNGTLSFNNGGLVNAGSLTLSSPELRTESAEAKNKFEVGTGGIPVLPQVTGNMVGRGTITGTLQQNPQFAYNGGEVRIYRGTPAPAGVARLYSGRAYGVNDSGPWLSDESGGARASIVGPTGNVDSEAYARVVENSFVSANTQLLSTFGLDVDTASYANIRRFLTQGQLPPRDAVRIEEMLSYFSYDYPAPRGNEPFALYVEAGECPWNPSHRLALIGLKAKDIAPRKMQSMNLVFLIDVSGSMQPDNKLPLIQSALRLLVDRLSARDRVAIVVYASESRVVLPSVPGDDRETILDAIDSLHADGSTNGGAGIQSAYTEARNGFIEGGVNRVILCTDGDFNVGITDQSDLVQLIKREAKSGVFLSVLGFGMGNLKDATMEKLADKGNGNYHYIDDLEEARKVLVDQMRSTLVTVAKDAKVQIEFNPALVQSYRLIGYEKRMMAARDFNNDRKDAGDIGAGHTVTALYEIVPADEPGRGRLMTVNLRYKEPDADKSQLLTASVNDEHTTWRRASDDFRFAAAVATFGMVLRDSPYRGAANCDLALDLAGHARGRDDHGYRTEFTDLVRRARTLANPERSDDP